MVVGLCAFALWTLRLQGLYPCKRVFPLWGSDRATPCPSFKRAGSYRTLDFRRDSFGLGHCPSPALFPATRFCRIQLLPGHILPHRTLSDACSDHVSSFMDRSNGWSVNFLEVDLLVRSFHPTVCRHPFRDFVSAEHRPIGSRFAILSTDPFIGLADYGLQYLIV